MSEPNPNTELVVELQALRKELSHLNGHDFVKHLNSPWRQMMHNFLRGLVFGLGSVLGGTVVVAFVLYVLAHVDFIPIVGEWAARITDIIQSRN
jgi:Domain of unknown function (DUF5665)